MGLGFSTCCARPSNKRDNPNNNMAKKQTSNQTSSLASDVLAGRKVPTPAEIRRLAASALSQDEKKGKR
jgi:hypothetical protein